ncbi:class I SAM-dependent methyltransferase [Oceanobacter kriegii]|uniref:class I SAM-dependent methyltransferase n=1 Tax=Oceanobacter kriegii TaxID=64972 RepID=UPI00040A9F0F|nr:class I SAM-dependent methyltransferase [Oceanobacter kriegii]
MSQAPYQLLCRHEDLHTDRTLVISAEANLDPDWVQLARDTGVSLQSWNWTTYQNAKRQLGEDKVSFGVPDNELPDNTERVILLWPKSKVLAQALVEQLAKTPDHRYLPELWIVGANDAGGKSINNALKSLADCEKQDSARRCSLWSALLKPQEGSFNWLRLAKPTPYKDDSFLSLPGVFSQGSLDAGTELLLETLPPLHGNALDLGCGSGIIGLTTVNDKTTMTLSDVDAMALRSAALNSARKGLEVSIVPSDGLADISGRFNYILSNPPFHSGKETDYTIVETLFRQARDHLTVNGEVWLVANRHLPYEELAKGHFSQIEEMASGRGFKVIRLRR